MAAYYYLAASLPMLTGPDMAPPLASAEFLDACRRFMPARDFRGIEGVALKPDNRMTPEKELWPRVYREFYLWECSLRNNLASLRAASQSLPEDSFLRPGDQMFGTASVAEEAMGKTSPLEAELFLDAARWMKISELSAGHFFDMDFLVAYSLQLQLLERRAMFEEERGFAAYRGLYERVLEASGAQIPSGGKTV